MKHIVNVTAYYDFLHERRMILRESNVADGEYGLYYESKNEHSLFVPIVLSTSKEEIQVFADMHDFKYEDWTAPKHEDQAIQLK